jgi:hypothetical protein
MATLPFSPMRARYSKSADPNLNKDKLCIRARLQSCRMDRKKSVGFSPWGMYFGNLAAASKSTP